MYIRCLDMLVFHNECPWIFCIVVVLFACNLQKGCSEPINFSQRNGAQASAVCRASEPLMLALYMLCLLDVEPGIDVNGHHIADSYIWLACPEQAQFTFRWM